MPKVARAYTALALTCVALFLLLLPALPIRELEEPRRVVMTQFYLSIVLALVLTYIFYAAGRVFSLGLSDLGTGPAGSLARWGFPLAHRHAYGDFGRLYALLFLLFIGPALAALFVTLLASGFVGFEGTVEISEDGASGFTETQAIIGAANGDIALNADDTARVDQVANLRNSALAVSYAVFMVLFARLVPYFFWRSGGAQAATFAQTWRAVPWRWALLFGLALYGLLAVLYVAPVPLVLVYALASVALGLWALAYAAAMRGVVVQGLDQDG